MQILHPLVLIALLTSTVDSAPARPKREGRSFKIPRVRRDNYVPHGPTALGKTHRKFGFGPKIPFHSSSSAVQTQSNAATNTEEGEVKASPEQGDVEFLSPVSVGGQTLMMDFDTGSSDFWVFNTQLSPQLSQGHTIYDPSKSSTFQVLQGSTFNVSYGDGSFASGPVGVETIDIGGATVTAQAIGLPTDVSPSFAQDTASNGLVGLAFSSINTVKPQQQRTFFSNVVASLDEPVLTAALRHDSSGAYEFGRVDTTKFQGDLSYTTVDSSNGFWEFESARFAIGNGAPQTALGGSGTAIADTGTSLMLVDEGVAQAYYSNVNGAQLDQQQGGYVFPCNSELPDLSVGVGGSYMATVPGSLINFADTGTTTQSGDPVCFGGLQSSEGLGLQIYGDVFLKSQFVVFDGGNRSLGIAPHA